MTEARDDRGYPAAALAEEGLYRANGLLIRSEIELPELRSGGGLPDVVIRYGTAPEDLRRPVLRAPRGQASPGEYLLRVDGVARYWVRDGRDVVVDPAPGAGEDDIRTFLLSSVMGVLAHQRGFLPLHASAVAMDGGCVLFAGGSGTGKSTLAAAFRRRGYPVVADDISAISVNSSGRPFLQAGYGQLKLWGDALEGVGAGLGESRRVRPGVDKYSVFLPDDAPAGPFAVHRIFVLSPRLMRPGDEVELEPLRGREKMATLLRETYRFRLVFGLGRSERHLELCHAVARKVTVTLVHRVIHPSHLSRTVDVLEARAINGRESVS